MKHFLIACGLVLVTTLGVGIGLSNARLLPRAASAQAGPIDAMFNFHFWAIAFLFSLIVVFMLYSILFFRRPEGDTADADYVTGNTRLEVSWTVVPLIAVVLISFWGAQVLDETRRPDPQALQVEVISSQWSWRFEYPEYGIVSSELVLPVGRQARLMLTSLDVIHSFWVPEFRVKQDALPGGPEMVRELRVTPTEVGEYQVRCAELCGRLHAEMRSLVRVLPEAEFESWIREQEGAVSDDPVERGRVWATQFGCDTCHSIDGGPGVGPTWKGLFGHEVPLADGTTVIADEDYLFESIRDPQAKIVRGFPDNVMTPQLTAELTDEQVLDIIEFIETLE